jgi:hypothetical protein
MECAVILQGDDHGLSVMHALSGLALDDRADWNLLGLL